MSKIESTLNSFQDNVLSILASMRLDMADMTKHSQDVLEEDVMEVDNTFNSLIPLDTMDKYDSFELNLMEIPFRENFIKFLKTIGGKDGHAIRNMTRAVFDDAVLCEFTWEGTATKRALKSSSILNAFLKVQEGSTVHDLKTFYGPYLRNAPLRFRSRNEKKKGRNTSAG